MNGWMTPGRADDGQEGVEGGGDRGEGGLHPGVALPVHLLPRLPTVLLPDSQWWV